MFSQGMALFSWSAAFLFGIASFRNCANFSSLSRSSSSPPTTSDRPRFAEEEEEDFFFSPGLPANRLLPSEYLLHGRANKGSPTPGSPLF
jgi:hypothetical protein